MLRENITNNHYCPVKLLNDRRQVYQTEMTKMIEKDREGERRRKKEKEEERRRKKEKEGERRRKKEKEGERRREGERENKKRWVSLSETVRYPPLKNCYMRVRRAISLIIIP